MENLESERNFYYGKLRDIELLCHDIEPEEATALVKKIKEILYATEEGFGPPAEGETEEEEPEKNGNFQEEY